MKDTGLILGDDFINSAFYLQMKFGVVEAVQDFVRKHGYEFLAAYTRLAFRHLETR